MATWTNQNQSTLAGSGGVVGGSLGANLVAASSIAITDFVHFVSGSATISTISGGISRPQEIFLIPLAGSTWTLGSSGNVKAFSSTPVLDRPIHLVWDGSTTWREVAPPATAATTAFTPALSANTGSWSIGAVTTARYLLTGNLMTVFYAFNAVTVAGAPVELNFAIPAGRTAAFRADNALGACLDAGAVFSPASAKVAAAGTVVILYKPSGAAWANGGGASLFFGQISFEVS